MYAITEVSVVLYVTLTENIFENGAHHNTKQELHRMIPTSVRYLSICYVEEYSIAIIVEHHYPILNSFSIEISCSFLKVIFCSECLKIFNFSLQCLIINTLLSSGSYHYEYINANHRTRCTHGYFSRSPPVNGKNTESPVNR